MDRTGKLKKNAKKYRKGSPLNEPLLRALIAGFVGDYASTVKHLDDAVDKTGKFDEVNSLVYYLKSVSLSNLDRHEEALSAINLAIQFDPTGEANWATKGDVLYDLGRQGESLIAYEKSLELARDDDNDDQVVSAILSRVDVLTSLGRHKESLKECEKAEKIDPCSTDVLFRKAHELFKLEKYQESLAACERGLAINCADLNLIIYQGIAKLELGLVKESLKHFDKAIVLDSANVLAWFSKACALSKLDRKEETLDALTIAIELDPRNKEVMMRKKVFENIHNEERFTRLLKQSL